jgi:hypothetical protein
MFADWIANPPDLSAWLFSKPAWTTGAWTGSIKGVFLSFVFIIFWVKTVRPGWTSIDRTIERELTSNVARWITLPAACAIGLVGVLYAFLVWDHELYGLGMNMLSHYAMIAGLFATPLLVAALAMRIAPYGRPVNGTATVGLKRKAGLWAAGLAGTALTVAVWLELQALDFVRDDLRSLGDGSSVAALHYFRTTFEHMAWGSLIGTIAGLVYASKVSVVVRPGPEPDTSTVKTQATAKPADGKSDVPSSSTASVSGQKCL